MSRKQIQRWYDAVNKQLAVRFRLKRGLRAFARLASAVGGKDFFRRGGAFRVKETGYAALKKMEHDSDGSSVLVHQYVRGVTGAPHSA